jgi:hypothetical protein
VRATGRIQSKPADSGDLGRLLRLGGERRGEEAALQGGNEGPTIYQRVISRVG